MQKLITLGEVSDTVDALSRNCVDRMIPVQDITFDSLNTVRIANEPFELRDMAQLSFAYRLGIPLQYLKRCPPEIQKYNLNHWITKEKNEELLFRFDGSDVRVVFTPVDTLLSTISRSWRDSTHWATVPIHRCSVPLTMSS